jgi:1-acyl-sn-glycerol-3-phosphate acyltransferase
MIIARSLAFNVAFYVVTLLEMIVFSPVYFIMPRKKAWFVPKFWAHTNLFLQKWLAGTDKLVEGLENLPEGSYIVAPKHQSSWDTYALLPHIPDGLLILKRELMWIPIFGWYVAKMRMIPIDRGARGKVLKDVVRLTRERMQEGRQLIIYPEGTRRAPGEAPAYKWGIAEIYSQLGVPVVPIAHVAGLYWPRRKFWRYPGTIKVRVLPPIEPGLGKEEFLERLIRETEAACDELLVEAALSDNPPPMPPSARRRLAELGVEPPRTAG